MAHTCLEKFPVFTLEKFLVCEVADMHRKDVAILRTDAATTMHRIEKLGGNILQVNCVPLHWNMQYNLSAV